MKQTKIICLLAAAAVLTLGPISTGQTQPQTVYASQVSGDSCIDLGNGWFKCPKDIGGWDILLIKITKRLHDRHFSLGFQAGLTLYGSGLKASKIY